MSYRAVLLVGAPGSGKGTQGRILGHVPGFRHCACGDVLRSIDPSSEMGRTFQAYLSHGELVPDSTVVQIWAKTIRELERSREFRPERETLVLDGIPRNLAQAKLLDGVLEVRAVIELVCNNTETIAARLRRRAVEEGRADDAREDVIARRLSVYRQETAPILKFYGSRLTWKLDASASPLEVAGAILAHLAEIKGGTAASKPTARETALDALLSRDALAHDAATQVALFVCENGLQR